MDAFDYRKNNSPCLRLSLPATNEVLSVSMLKIGSTSRELPAHQLFVLLSN